MRVCSLGGCILIVCVMCVCVYGDACPTAMPAYAPSSNLWRFSTAWYGTVRFGMVSLLGGFPLGTVPGTMVLF